MSIHPPHRSSARSDDMFKTVPSGGAALHAATSQKILRFTANGSAITMAQRPGRHRNTETCKSIIRFHLVGEPVSVSRPHRR